MNNPFDLSSQPSSPQQPNNPPQKQPANEVSSSQEFFVHTMKDDLANLQKNPQAMKMPEAPTAKESVPTPFPVSQIQEQSRPQTQPPRPEPHISNNANPDLAKAFFEQSKVPTTSKQQEIIEVEMEKKSASGLKKTLFIVIPVIVIVFVIALGGYYFWKTRTAGQENSATQTQSQTPVIITPVEKYSLEKPNYLTLDIATLSSEAIETSLESVAAELKDKSDKSLYEFVVVDVNNNPVAFPIFATAAKWNLSSTLLENLGENFSLYYYIDGENVRLGVAATITSKSIVKEELLKQETAFITDASFLFLGNTPAAPAAGFKDSTYSNAAVRYMNLSDQIPLSIDYSVTDLQMIIGTSKDTLRAILNKTLEAVPLPAQSAVNPTPVVENQQPSPVPAPIPVQPTEPSAAQAQPSAQSLPSDIQSVSLPQAQ